MRLPSQARCLIGVALLLCILPPASMAASGLAVGGTLCLSPQAGIGLVAQLPWWDLRCEVVYSGDSSGGAAQVTRNWPVRRAPFFRYDLEPFALGLFAGARFSSPGGLSLVGGVGKQFHLYPDLHLDLDLGLSFGQSSGGFCGLKAVQDL
ncbi:MAG: hypothetical protein ACM3XZ_09995 [Betaproteobacteria bacterium]